MIVNLDQERRGDEQKSGAEYKQVRFTPKGRAIVPSLRRCGWIELQVLKNSCSRVLELSVSRLKTKWRLEGKSDRIYPGSHYL